MGTPVLSSSLPVDYQTVQLGFDFVLFGQTYSSASVSSKGYVSFGGDAGAQATVQATQLMQSLPRIAPAWYDIDVANSGGTIFFNSFDHRAVFTFMDVGSYAPPPGYVSAPSNLASFQLIVYEDGTVVFGYAAFNALDQNVTGVPNSILGSSQAILGITSGMGADDPGGTNLLSEIRSAPGFAYTTANSTVYQIVGNDPADGTDLAGINFIFTPHLVTNWTVTTVSDAPAPAPEPGTSLMAAAGGVLFLLFKSRQRHG